MSRNLASPRVARPAFTLIELLVVVGLIALLIGILLPALSAAREAAARTKCLSNMRSLQVAQALYCSENNNYLIRAGYGEAAEEPDGDVLDPTQSWFAILQRYGSTHLLPRCPSDESPHFAGGTPVSGSGATAIYRTTSYGINDFLDADLCPWGPNFSTDRPPGGWYAKITQVRRPSVTIQFVELASTGSFAAADHPHVEEWSEADPAGSAKVSMRINAHDRRFPAGNKSVANYGFLDGHAETLPFDAVFQSFKRNKFDPSLAE